MAATTIDWYRTPIDKETLRQLTQRSDLRGWLQSGSFLLIYAALTALAVYFFLQRWWVPMVVACYAPFAVREHDEHVRGGARAEPRDALQDEAGQRVLPLPLQLPHVEQPRAFPGQPHPQSPPVHRATAGWTRRSSRCR